MKEKKSRQLYPKSALVRCTEKELKHLHEKAGESNMSLSRYLVKAGLSGGQVLSPEERDEIRKLRLEIRKIGVNLNQITHNLNASRRGNNLSEPTADEIKSVAKAVEATLDELLKLL